MKKIALIPLVAGIALLAIGVLLSSITSLASPETSGAALVVVDINVADEGDPDGHAVHIGMSAQLTLNINFDFNIDSQTGDITIDSLDGTGWVSVSGAIQDGQIFAHGSGKVAGFQDIAVIFEGKFDEEGGLSGQYRMGTALGLPPNDFTGEAHPIKYTVKPNRVCEPGGVAGCPATATSTETEEGQPPVTPTATPTATVPGLTAPTDTPVPFDLSIVAKMDADSGVIMNGWEMNVFQGDGCTGSSFLSGPTEDLGEEFGSGYAVFLPPGDYSVSETQQPGWERIPGTPFCQNFIPGDIIVFRNRRIRDGDVNNDGVTNSLDVLLVLQTIAGLIPEPPNYSRADVNNDGTVNVVDTALMLQFEAGFLDSLPVGSGPTPVPTATPTFTPVPSSTPVPPPTAAPATSTNTPAVTSTPTATPDTGKISITVEGGPGRPMAVHQSGGCTGSAFASVTVSGSISLSFSPGSYSILAGDIKGWELVEGVEACQEVDLTAGQKIDVTFTYQAVT